MTWSIPTSRTRRRGRMSDLPRHDEASLELDLDRAEPLPEARTIHAEPVRRVVARAVSAAGEPPRLVEEARVAPVEGQVRVAAAVDVSAELARRQPHEERAVPLPVDLDLEGSRRPGRERGELDDRDAHG